MIQIDFTSEEIDALDYERFHHPHPKVQRKMEVLYLKSRGLSHKEIRRLCRISKGTLVTYLNQYQDSGIDGLKQLNYKGQFSKLNDHSESLEAYFRANQPRSIAEAQDVIEQKTGLKRSPTQIRAFLNRLGLKCRKVGSIPGKDLTPEKLQEQETFKDEKLMPRLEEAKSGQRVVFFVDAAHFVHGAFLGFVWCFVRLFIPTPSGRKRFNVLGALNAVTHELHTITNQTYINAESVCQLLSQIAALKINVPITLILDNARYQKCKMVQAYADLLGIELLYLPSYSPHLNLIERYWRFVKKECLYSKYYSDFTKFKTTIETCINTAHVTKKEKLESLLTWNFQSFKKVQILPV